MKSAGMQYKCGLGKAEQIFWGLGFRFSSAECFLKFGEIGILPAGGVWGGMRAGI